MASQKKRTVLLLLAMVGGLGSGLLCPVADGLAQTGADPGLTPTESGTIEPRGVDEGPAARSATPRTDEAIAEQRRMEQERLQDQNRYAERRRHRGETYIAGFGGGTIGSTTSNMEGRGTAVGQPVPSDLADSIVYGMKIGYFHPGRLNWLGLEIEGYNSTPHLKQSGPAPGSHLRLTTLGLNAIARTKLACGEDRRDRRDDDYDSPLADNARCPLHLYAGAGLGVFFAETSNQFGRSTENARAGLNALAGVKYFFNEHISLFAEYKFNYVDLKFDQFAGPTAGLNGTYLINHVVGGLAVHF